MTKTIKNTLSPKLMIAAIAAASFIITPAISYAGEKGQNKKAEMTMKKDAHKAEMKAKKAACKADPKNCSAEMKKYMKEKKDHKKEMKEHKKEMKAHKKEMKKKTDD